MSPRSGGETGPFANVYANSDLYESLVSGVQRFRGTIYTEDGTIPVTALDDLGRHYTHFDTRSWHLITLDPMATISGCVRVTMHDEGRPRSTDLKIQEIVDRMDPETAARYHGAICAFMQEADGSGLKLAEVGGWAVRKEWRHRGLSTLIALSCWSLCHLLGGALWLASPGRCNQSSEILRRLGGCPLTHEGEELQAFYDDHHRCEIEILGFDSRRPAAKYEEEVALLKSLLGNALVVKASPAQST